MYSRTCGPELTYEKVIPARKPRTWTCGECEFLPKPFYTASFGLYSCEYRLLKIITE